MLLAVDDDSRDLLVHEDEDGGEESGESRGRDRPHWVLEGVDQPASVVTCRLDAVGHEKLGRVETHDEVDEDHADDGDHDGEVADDGTRL